MPSFLLPCWTVECGTVLQEWCPSGLCACALKELTNDATGEGDRQPPTEGTDPKKTYNTTFAQQETSDPNKTENKSSKEKGGSREPNRGINPDEAVAYGAAVQAGMKRALSSTHQARVEIEALFDGEDFSETLTRARFEEINNDLFKNTLGPVKQVMEDSGLKKTQIDEIVLVGGSTCIPKAGAMHFSLNSFGALSRAPIGFRCFSALTKTTRNERKVRARARARKKGRTKVRTEV